MSSQQRSGPTPQHNLVPTLGPGPGIQMTVRVPSEHSEPHPLYADSAILSSIPVTRVMSPTLTMFGEGQGWLALTTCPCCSTFVRDPVLCTACGSFGHPACLGAEMFQGLPFCGTCFSEIIAEYSGRRDAEKREEWRKTKAQQFALWKSRAITILGVSTTVGNTIGAASASLVGSAYGLAKGVTTGILETVQTSEKNVVASVDKTHMTAKEAKAMGHCISCHTRNPGHNVHLKYGDCLKRPAIQALPDQSHNIPIPDDDFDLAEEPSFHSISNSAIPEKSKDVLKDGEDPGQVEQVQTAENTTQTDGPNPDVLLQRLAEVESMLADVMHSQTNTDDETKVNSKRLGILEAEVSKWNMFYENEDQQLHATGQCPSKQEPEDDLDPAVEEALENEFLVIKEPVMKSRWWRSKFHQRIFRLPAI